jgi:hypothetical protein
MREHIMDKVALEGFVEFVQGMPPTKNVDNTNWGTCAVGEYLRSIGGHGSEPEGYRFSIDVLEPLGVAPLGSATYGRMQEYLTELGY